ncbi:polypeptide-transport-associated domain-containing protein [Calothrix sp. NIES-4071]|nr:polypeptide-transport-associated domain-containing protein [Calothrix sp. NIES-4071]BAZ54492.1 polypeptide-transport-associated domain-containing protein [Calothrix sp. NIES-4105]
MAPLSVCILVANQTFAQTPPQTPIIPGNKKPNPNIDRFPQPQPIPDPLAPSDQTPIIPTPQQNIPEVPTVKIPVRKIEVIGSTVLSQEEISTITKPFIERTVTLKELIGLANTITQTYLNRGYITSRAVLADQTITNGTVKIIIIEGSLEKIEVVGATRLNPNYIRSRIQLGTGIPLRSDKLESQLRLLKADPLFTNIAASLKAGTGLGKSILTVKVTEASPISGFASIDNYSPPAVGSERVGGIISYRNLTGIGDELSAYYYRTTPGGANSFDFAYRVPLNAMNGTLQLRYAPSDSKIIEGDIAKLNISANSQLYEVSYRQPLVRTPATEFALSLGFTVQDGQTFLDGVGVGFGNGASDQGNSKTRVLKIGQDYIRRDLQGAWAVQSQFSIGLGILDATINSDSIPDGRFFSWLGQIQRVQRLNRDNVLIAQVSLQLTPDTLLSSQQFVIGGGLSLRGYRQNARLGDNGLRISLENRIAIERNNNGQPNLQLAPFIDVGAVWNNNNNIEQKILASTGLGLLWEPLPNLLVKLDYAVPLVNLRDKGNNAQDEGLNFSIGYNF